MQYREIITEAWDLTKKHTYLNWLAAIPLGIEFILAAVYVPIRFGLYIFPDILTRVANLVQEQYALHHNETLYVLIFFAAVFFLYLLVPTFCEGALIATIAKIVHSGDDNVKSQHSIAFGLNVYIPLVELHGMTGILNPLYVFLSMSLLHQFNPALFSLFIYPAIFLFVVEVLIYFALIFSKYELVIKDAGVLASMMKSIRIVMFNISETFFIIMLMLLIVGRAIVNFLIVFLIPGAIYFLATYFLSFISQGALIALVAIGFIIAYYYALKTASVLVVFTSFVFTMSYFHLTSNESDVILKTKEVKNEPVAPVVPQYPQVMPHDALEILGRTLVHEMEKIALEKKSIHHEPEIALPAPDKTENTSQNPNSLPYPSSGISKNTFEIPTDTDQNNSTNTQ